MEIKFLFNQLIIFILASSNLAGDRWKLHPDWVYCEYNYGGQSGKMFDNPETNMVHFLKRLEEVKFQICQGRD